MQSYRLQGAQGKSVLREKSAEQRILQGDVCVQRRRCCSITPKVCSSFVSGLVCSLMASSNRNLSRMQFVYGNLSTQSFLRVHFKYIPMLDVLPVTEPAKRRPSLPKARWSCRKRRSSSCPQNTARASTKPSAGPPGPSTLARWRQAVHTLSDCRP